MSCNTCSDLIKTCTGPSLCIPGTTSRRIHSSSRCRLSAAVCGLGLQILSRALLQHNPGTRGSTYFHKSRLATLHSTYTKAQRLLYTEIGCGCPSLTLEQAAKPPSSSWAPAATSSQIWHMPRFIIYFGTDMLQTLGAINLDSSSGSNSKPGAFGVATARGSLLHILLRSSGKKTCYCRPTTTEEMGSIHC